MGKIPRPRSDGRTIKMGKEEEEELPNFDAEREREETGGMEVVEGEQEHKHGPKYLRVDDKINVKQGRFWSQWLSLGLKEQQCLRKHSLTFPGKGNRIG